MPIQVIASCVALGGFAIALVAGIAVDNTAATILSRALGAMVACYLAGLIVAAIAHQAMTENIEQYRRQNPLTIEQDDDAAPSQAQAAAPAPHDTDDATARRNAA